MRAKIAIILMAFIISLFVSACGSGGNSIDMKKLKDTMQRDSTVSSEKKAGSSEKYIPKLEGKRKLNRDNLI